jgi:hypothetical protein
MDKIDILINNLKQSPLFYLFLSSKELFHSNFWSWLSMINKEETLKLFIKNFSDFESADFIREHKQKNSSHSSKVDLLIRHPKSLIVIENKVKDFPKCEQLERIRKSFNDENVEYILVTLFCIPDLSFNGWSIKTYKDISEEIIPNNFSSEPYYQGLISDYKTFTKDLSDLIENLGFTDKYDFAIAFERELFEKLNEIKIWEGYQKMRASHLLNNFNKNNIHNVLNSYGINNQKATITFSKLLNKNYEIGIQIENNQFRRFIRGVKHEEFSKSLIDSNIFFRSNWKSPRDKKETLGYKPDFKYQYEKIDVLTFSDLFKKINKEFETVLNNWDAILAKIPSS